MSVGVPVWLRWEVREDRVGMSSQKGMVEASWGDGLHPKTLPVWLVWVPWEGLVRE